MATNIRARVIIGLTMIGSFGWATVRDHAEADEPRESSPRSLIGLVGPERYLLLTDGRMIKGVITDDHTGYNVSQNIGVMRFKKANVEGVFETLRDAYRYRVEQLPDRDPDERMKLARWCLNLHMKAEAREQLAQVLEVNHKQAQARAMLFSMEQDAAIVAQRQRDPDVKQAGAESMTERGPGALDAAVIHGAQRGLNIGGMPVIFDLPTALAIKRKNEFFRYVHPVLQHYCVKCHDGHYDGPFQLVPIMSRADNTPEAQRANLDAVLRLVDQENPAKSELLTSTLRAHGRGPRPRSIFPGSNDLTYQILATWAQSLRIPKKATEAAAAPAERTGGENEDAFAAGRDRLGREGLESTKPELPENDQVKRNDSGRGARTPIPRPLPLGLRGTPAAERAAQAAPDAFPLPFVLTGKMPNLAGPSSPAGATGGRSPAIAPPRSAAGPDSAATSAKSTPTAGKASEPTLPPTDPAAPKKKAKPITIDPTLLERALQNRNGSR
jgi:hypothetical protein